MELDHQYNRYHNRNRFITYSMLYMLCRIGLLDVNLKENLLGKVTKVRNGHNGNIKGEGEHILKIYK